MDLFKLDPGLAIWTWISFGIVFFILARFVFPNLLKSIENREKTINDSLDKAEEINARLQEIQQEREEIIKKAQIEADEILRKTRTEAEGLRKDLLAKADEEVQKQLEQGRLQVSEERRQMLQTLQEELADFVCLGAERVVGSSFTSDKDKALARDLVDAL